MFSPQATILIPENDDQTYGTISVIIRKYERQTLEGTITLGL